MNRNPVHNFMKLRTNDIRADHMHFIAMLNLPTCLMKNKIPLEIPRVPGK
jgi:hypothetical protein